MRRKKSLLGALVALALAAPCGAIASNLGFEDGDLAGWTASGNAAVSGISPGGRFLPVEGDFLAYATAGGAAGAASSISRRIRLGAGQILAGLWGFDAWEEADQTGRAFVMIDGVEIDTRSLADLGPSGRTDWIPFDFMSAARRDYVLTVGVEHAGDNSFDGVVVLDGVGIITEVSVVPAPAAAAVFGAGLLGLAASLRRRRPRPPSSTD